MQILFGILLSAVALFMILLVLVQRGRGGGLAGALGGAGGQSAFGAKAGDTFTWVTIGAALCWILLSVAAIKMLDDTTAKIGGDFVGAGTEEPAIGAPKTGDQNEAAPAGDAEAGASSGAPSGAPTGDASTPEPASEE